MKRFGGIAQDDVKGGNKAGVIATPNFVKELDSKSTGFHKGAYYKKNGWDDLSKSLIVIVWVVAFAAFFISPGLGGAIFIYGIIFAMLIAAIGIFRG